ncbi:hypothetical protein MPSEU_000442600 [Mayamaea pseudoterrestris]|nr:hypothetical protein MPSEU_000442600 [Mayamaea pseudoterrestris]
MMSIILLSCYFALAAGSPMTASVQSMAAVPCETDKDCKTQVDAYSTCRFPAGLCSTNAYEQGCLYRHGASDKIRVCNSEDGPTAAEEGLCRIADIEYSEVRLFSNDWESAIFETWILQIVLSELLNVPTTTESGVYGAKNDFYNAQSSIQFGDSDFLPAMTTAASITDCREARKDPQNYTPCAHVVSEVWHASEAAVLLKNGSAKPPLSLGVLGQEALFVPKFTGERDPTLLSYMGITGRE